MSTRKRKISSSYYYFFAAERLFCLFWLAIHPCQNYVRWKLEYIFFFDIDKCKKCYFYRCYCDLAPFLIEMDRINIDCAKLDEKILKIEVKVFCFRCQCKLFLRRLRELGDREARNIEDIQRAEKKAESRRNIDPGFSVSDNLFFIASEADRALAAVSDE